MEWQKILRLFDINVLVAAVGVTVVLIGYIAWAWMTWVLYMWELFVIVGSVLIVVTFIVLCATLGLWSFWVRKFVPVVRTVAHFLSVYVLYCFTRILLGYLLYLAVYEPIVNNLHPFRNIGPTWSNWSKFWYQVSLWVTPYVLYTFVILPLPVIFIFVATYFQQRRFSSFLLEQGSIVALKKFCVNGMTNVISVTLFETLLTFGFMMALMAYDIVPDYHSMDSSSSSAPIDGKIIFFIITECPLTPVTT